MKKSLFVLIAALIFCFVGCNDSNGSSVSEASSHIQQESAESEASLHESSEETVDESTVLPESSEAPEDVSAELPDADKIIYNPIKIEIIVSNGGHTAFLEQKDNTEKTVGGYLEENEVPDGYYFYVSITDNAIYDEYRIDVLEYAQTIGMIITDNSSVRCYGYITPDMYRRMQEDNFAIMLAWLNDPSQAASD